MAIKSLAVGFLLVTTLCLTVYNYDATHHVAPRSLLSSSLSTNTSGNADMSICTDTTGELSDQSDACAGGSADTCKKLDLSTSGGVLGLCLTIFGLLYMFIGIAIVCDELFVPALDLVGERLDLSNDIAGATLMAAGGSAPELATSFVGTFKRSDVGFGTIVGSAVFNVMFVIGCCVVATPAKFQPLKLDWYPLARDCSYYVITLATLVGFMSDGIIHWYEALAQFSLYFGYVCLMAKSEKLEAWLKGRRPKIAPALKRSTAETTDAKYAGDGTADDEKSDAKKALLQSPPDSPPRIGRVSTTRRNKELGDLVDQAYETNAAEHDNVNLKRPGAFRAGIHQLMTAKESLFVTAGIACVFDIQGDVDAVFDKLDDNGNGKIDSTELKAALSALALQEDLSDEAIQGILEDIDQSGEGAINKTDFTLWYTRSAQRLKKKVKDLFDEYDSDSSGKLTKSETVAMMVRLGHDDGEVLKEILATELLKEGETAIPFEAFWEWYSNTSFFEYDQSLAQQAAVAQESMWMQLKGNCASLGDKTHPMSAKAYFIFTLPLSLLFVLIPDCRTPSMHKWAPATLFGSVVCIALLSIVMVECAEIFGKTLGIPDVIMGLTILAAGTSAPDLLSSVIVAQHGQGDMAVSSSIGSNIFDVAVGLPLPWLCFNIFTLVKNCACQYVIVESDGLFPSLLILLGMVAILLILIRCAKWELTRNLGCGFFVLYVAYVVYALVQTPTEDFEPDECSGFSGFMGL